MSQPKSPPQFESSRDAPSLALLALYLAGLELYLWWVLPLRSPAATALGAAVIAAILVVDPWRRGETGGSLGLGVRHLASAARALVPVTVGVALAVVVTGWLVPGGGHGRRFATRLVAILPWAALQQLLLQAVFNRRLTRAFGSGWRAAIATGACFGLMHLPGVWLTVATATLGTVWARNYQQRPSLWPPVLAHAFLSALAQSWLPAAWTHGFRVGPGWYRWHG